MSSPTEEVADLMKKTVDEEAIQGLSAVKDWCSTGCTNLDLAIADKLPGGAPVGRVVQLFGAASTAKSVIAATILGYALRSGKQAFLTDVEYTFDPHFASIYGLDSTHSDFHWGYDFTKEKQSSDQPETIEEFFDNYLEKILKLRSRKPKVVVLDTLTALPSVTEVKEAMTAQGYATTRAKAISAGLRKYLAEMNQKNVTLVCLDQTRDNVGGFGSTEVTNGGRGMEFYASTRIHLKKGPKVENSKGRVIGVWVKYQIIKNKVAPPFREGFFKILFDYGMDNITSNLAWIASTFQSEKNDCYKLTTSIPIVTCPKCYKLHTFPDDCKHPDKMDLTGVFCDGHQEKEIQLVVTSKRIMEWISHIEKHSLEPDLNNIVAAKWAEVYAPEERKVRVW